MSVGKFFAGAIIGGAVGAVLGLLLAPQSGEDTRKMLADGSTELYKKSEDSIKDLQEKADVVMEDLQEKADDILKKINELLPKKEQV